jgi:hypothetical protein
LSNTESTRFLALYSQAQYHDPIRAAAERSDFTHSPQLGYFMTPDPLSIPSSAALSLATLTMLWLKVTRFPILDDGGA